MDLEKREHRLSEIPVLQEPCPATRPAPPPGFEKACQQRRPYNGLWFARTESKHDPIHFWSEFLKTRLGQVLLQFIKFKGVHKPIA